MCNDISASKNAKGTQGTMLGRNRPGGISIASQRAGYREEAKVRARLGNYGNAMSSEVNIPLTSDVAFRSVSSTIQPRLVARHGGRERTTKGRQTGVRGANALNAPGDKE